MTARRRGFAATAPDAPDPALRRRVYAVPFEHVWQAATTLAGGRLRGWSVLSADDDTGEIIASAAGVLSGTHDVWIRIALDDNAQTTVDATASGRGRTDLGRSARRLRRFLTALDRLAAHGRATAGRSA